MTFMATLLGWVHVSETREISPLSWVMIEDGLCRRSPLSLNVLPYILPWPSPEDFCQPLQPSEHSPPQFDPSVSGEVSYGHCSLQY